MAIKKNVNLERVVEFLLSDKWTPHGHTDSDAVRIPTLNAPVFGGIGGEGRILGGRRRFMRGDRRVTVGSRVVCFYKVVSSKISDMENIPTKDIERIIETSKNLPSV